MLAAVAIVALALRTDLPSPLSAQTSPSRGLTAVPGLKVGHHTLTERPTGCTVVLAEKGATAGVDVRGNAPGTRETDLLAPTASVEQVNAIMLAGGSAFGLDAASGVMRYLEQRGVGFKFGGAFVPIVPGAILFDLGVGDPKIRPTAECGFLAATAATDGPVIEGNVGAGAGATVGKMGGRDRAMKGGIGSAAITLPNGLVVAALVAVNARGDVIDPATGQVVAGMRTEDGKGLADVRRRLKSGELDLPLPEAAAAHDDRGRRDQRGVDEDTGDPNRADGPRWPRPGDCSCPHLRRRRRDLRARDRRAFRARGPGYNRHPGR